MLSLDLLCSFVFFCRRCCYVLLLWLLLLLMVHASECTQLFLFSYGFHICFCWHCRSSRCWHCHSSRCWHCAFCEPSRRSMQANIFPLPLFRDLVANLGEVIQIPTHSTNTFAIEVRRVVRSFPLLVELACDLVVAPLVFWSSPSFQTLRFRLRRLRCRRRRGHARRE